MSRLSDISSSRSCKARLDVREGKRFTKRWPLVERISRSGSKLGRRGRRMGEGDVGEEESGRNGWEDINPAYTGVKK